MVDSMNLCPNMEFDFIYNYECYKIYKFAFKMNYSMAREFCTKQNLNLPNINIQEDILFLFKKYENIEKVPIGIIHVLILLSLFFLYQDNLSVKY